MDVASANPELAPGELETNDLLPSVNMVYQVGEANMRLAYGRTLARPTFRELAPFSSFAFVGDFILTGNEELKRTLIDNYDLRWEWFPNPGEIHALSGFYKLFQNPIERAILTTNGEIRVPERGRGHRGRRRVRGAREPGSTRARGGATSSPAATCP